MAEEQSTSEGRSSRWRRAGWILAALVGVMVLIQLVPIRVSNPSPRATVPWDSPRTEALFDRACANCHSNRTHLEWFEHAAPISWWIKGHVDDGREALNVDEYPKIGETDDLADSVREGGMPPSYYTWFGMHSNAKLTPAEQDELARGLVATFGRGG